MIASMKTIRRAIRAAHRLGQVWEPSWLPLRPESMHTIAEKKYNGTNDPSKRPTPRERGTGKLTRRQLQGRRLR
jgi:hypothetical protein